MKSKNVKIKWFEEYSVELWIDGKFDKVVHGCQRINRLRDRYPNAQISWIR
ncbi:MAG: hypothetical protein AABY22_07860 [Nanoarchaeota archaeon]